jgi:Fic family protein
MRVPMTPPDLSQLTAALLRPNSAEAFGNLTRLLVSHATHERYLHWDEMRHRTPPDGLTHEQWWLATKIRRGAVRRGTGLFDPQGREFTYTLPDEVLREIEFVASTMSGQITLSEEVTNPATRDHYLVNSLIEEAIRSSQLEGAATTRQVAKDMIRSGRPPRSRGERMIANNLAAMRVVTEARAEKLAPDFICELQRIVTQGTLDDPSAAGRFQAPAEERVVIYDRSDLLLHQPPAAELLPERIERLCAFANGETDTGYLPPVLRAITLHFMLGYEHPFLDGNGRTARALFYWSMLQHGYWLTEFLSISRVLRQAPGRYARSFLHTETDDNDLTYFFIYQLHVLHQAIDELQVYLERKMMETRVLREELDPTDELFNHRQLALVKHALGHPAAGYTVESHRAAHRVVTETARQDLLTLADHGLLSRRRSGKRFVFAPVSDLAARLEKLRAAGNLGHHDE